MHFHGSLVILCTISVVAIASFGRGNSPLNDADDVSAVRPICQTDRAGNVYVPCANPDANDITNWPCLKLSDLCNIRRDCPNGEDEDPVYCFYHRLRSQQLHKLSKSLEEIRG